MKMKAFLVKSDFIINFASVFNSPLLSSFPKSLNKIHLGKIRGEISKILKTNTLKTHLC